jgi:hypothetical protein
VTHPEITMAIARERRADLERAAARPRPPRRRLRVRLPALAARRPRWI